MYNAITRVMAV